MAYCPECGSEVAPNDIFCAFCGFSLPFVQEQTEDVETQIEHTPTSDLAKDVPSKELLQNGIIPIETTSQVLVSETPIPGIEFENLENKGPISENSTDETTENEKNNEIVNLEKNIDGNSLEEVSQIVPDPIDIEESETDYSENSLEPISNEIQTEPKELNNEYFDKSELLDEQIEIETLREEVEIPAPDVGKDLDLAQNIDSAIDEIKEPVIEVEAISNQIPQHNDEMDFDQTIRDSYNPFEHHKTETIEPIEQYIASNPIDEEEKIKSVLDEIDLNLQKQNEGEPQEIENSDNDSGIIIPTAASLQGESFAVPERVEELSAPLASFEIPIEPEIIAEPKIPEIKETLVEAPEVLNTGQQVEPTENKSQAEQTPQDKEINFEGKAFTNPIVGVGETGGRNKTKLKPLEEGTILNNRYEIVRKIGGGGMGAVYLATDKNLGGVLRAVKEMVQSYIEDEQQEKAVNDFKRESLLLTSLEHQSIPTIYDYFFDEKEARFYLVMKYISGGDLSARLRSAPEGRIDEVSVTDWAIQITDVLDYLHNRQPPIVYRDLKPSNIMVDGNNGKLMIIDFGIARWVNKEEKGVTAVGTMGYAPPELFSGNVEPRSDIYSLGSTMFHLLTGADPQSNPLLIFDFNKNPKPRQINSQLSDQMEQILMRAVEYNSIQRFNSALEMREELLKHMENLKKGTVTFGIYNSTSGSPINANIPVFCGFCGQKIVATDMFCPFCGAQQPLAAQSKKIVQAPSYSAPKMFPKLAIVGTSDLETMDYVLEKDSNLLGRRDPMSNIFPEVDLSKFDPQTKISRKHARIWRENDVYMLEDLGSSNGTTLISTLNGTLRLLPRQPQPLLHGDKVKVGDTTLRFTIG